MNNSAEKLSFLEALALLLSQGRLRDEFRTNRTEVAARLCSRTSEEQSLIALVPQQLETQAEILLRKRLDSVRTHIPQTAHALRESLWPLFREYGRPAWQEDPIRDAFAFLVFLEQKSNVRICRLERNRLQFNLGHRRLALHLVTALLGEKRRPALQALVRSKGGRVDQFLFYLSL